MPEAPPLKPASIMPEVKPRTLDYIVAESKWSRLARKLPSGEQIIGFLRTLVWVAPLTLLIWVYAEREQTVTVSAAPFQIGLKTTAANHVVTLSYPQDGMLIPEFSGPRAKIDRIKELLVPRGDGPAVQLFIEPPPGEGPRIQELFTVQQLNNHPLFKNNGITVKSCQPAYLKVKVDVLRVEELPVVAPREVMAMLKEGEEPVFSPPSIRVQAPSQHFDDAGYTRQWYVTAQITADQLKNKTGAVTLENVPIQWFYRDNVTFSQSMVKATLSVKQADETFEIASMPVQLGLPPGMDDRRVQYNEQINNVTVVGPPEEIAKIKANTGANAIATLRIDAFAELDKEIRNQKLEFKLPPRVTLTEESRRRADEWTYTLIRRQ